MKGRVNNDRPVPFRENCVYEKEIIYIFGRAVVCPVSIGTDHDNGPHR